MHREGSFRDDDTHEGERAVRHTGAGHTEPVCVRSPSTF